MLGEAIKGTGELADRRFFLNAFMPSLLFCGAGLVVAVGARHDLWAALHTWQTLTVGVQITMLALFLAAVTLVAWLLESTRPSVLRWFEGYWSHWWGKPAALLGVQYHRRTATAWWHRADDRVHESYPPRADLETLLPTRLGNVLRSAELHPRVRYGIDAVVVWPRLYQVLPDRFLGAFAAARAALDLMLGLAALAATFALSSSTYVLIVLGPPSLFLACLWGGATIAYTAYAAALRSAAVYSSQLRTAFDLYRAELATRLGDTLPPTNAAEWEYWDRLSQYWFRALAREIRVAKAQPPMLTALIPVPRKWHNTAPLSAWLLLTVVVIGVLGATVIL